MVAAKMFWILWKNISSNLSKISSCTGNSEKKRGRYEPLDNDFEMDLDSNGNSLNNSQSESQQSMSKSPSCDTNGNIPKKTCIWKFTFDSNKSTPATTPDDDPMTDNSYPISAHFDEEEEGYICDVCDRAFSSKKKLEDHQLKKRHYGCLQCDSIFPSRQALEHHREQMDHYDYVSDYDSDTTSCDFELDDFDVDGNDLFGDEIHEEDELELLL